MTATPIRTRAEDVTAAELDATLAREREFRWQRWMDSLGDARPDED